MAKQKKCKGPCGRRLAATEKNFQPHYQTEDGLRHQCRKCQNPGGGKKKRAAVVAPEVAPSKKRSRVLSAVAVANTDNTAVYYLMEAAKKLASQTEPMEMNLNLPAGNLCFKYEPRRDK